MEVYALVGVSGTGKSHRAQWLAHQLKVNLIIDDGLLIKGSSIVGGTSAKNQATKIGAVKTALFIDDEHANEAIKLIHKFSPTHVLILGTSQRMVKKIAKRLELPPVSKFIQIEEIASPEEITKALQIRRQYNRHVIPAPTVEVKNRFSGSIINPLRIFFSKPNTYVHRRVQRQKIFWIEQTTVRPTWNYYGHFYIANQAIQDIAIHALYNIPEIAKVSKVNIITSTEGIRLDVDIVLHFSPSLNKTLSLAQQKISYHLEQMTALHILAINIECKKIIVPNNK
jgi:uncharacterized alkaline shock family protein YloU/adenylate kinase family enzyme